MPRENRKRGRGNRPKPSKPLKGASSAPVPAETVPEPEPVGDILDRVESQTTARGEAQKSQPPDGIQELDPDTRAYWRSIDGQIQEFSELGLFDSEDPEECQLLIRSALTELSGHEARVAVDPEASVVLERLAHVMDDFALRVLVDRFLGTVETLATHRHASHILQTLIALASSTLDREARGVIAQGPGHPGANRLPSMSELIVCLCKEVGPSIARLASDVSGSHVVRVLLMAVSGYAVSPDAHRSRKSAKWRAKKGPFRKSGGSELPRSAHPDEWESMALEPSVRLAGRELVDSLLSHWTEDQGQAARMAAVNPVSSSVVQILICLEGKMARSDRPGSLADSCLDGLISQAALSNAVGRSDFIESALRDTIPSHVLEAVIGRVSENTVAVFNQTYISGRLAKLAPHPVANFVVSKTVERLPLSSLAAAAEEMRPIMPNLIDNYRTGPIQALVGRCKSSGSHQCAVVDAIISAFGLNDTDCRKFAFPCLASLMRMEYFRKTALFRNVGQGLPFEAETTKLPESNMQGALLLQGLLRLNAPFPQIFLDSLKELPLGLVLALCYDPVSSRCIDAVLDSATTPARDRRQLITRFIGHFHQLANDRIGSRVADKCWEAADVYLKEKVASSLLEHARNMQASPFGHHFIRRLDLPLFERRRDEWKTKMARTTEAAGAKGAGVSQTPTEASCEPSQPALDPASKRKLEASNTIHQIFEPAKRRRQSDGRKSKAIVTAVRPDSGSSAAVDAAVADVLGQKGINDIRRSIRRQV